jgi:hypothetical protein
MDVGAPEVGLIGGRHHDDGEDCPGPAAIPLTGGL